MIEKFLTGGSEEETIEKEIVEEFDEKVAGFNPGDAHASFITYFRTDDDNLYNQIATERIVVAKITTLTIANK